jgi:SAM-dependent methyltransferase
VDPYDRVRARFIPDVDFHQNHYARLLEASVGDGVAWLDIGAGTKLHDGFRGASCAALAARATRLVGLDPVGAHLQENPYLTERVMGDAGALPFADESFDIVTANMVLEHLAAPDAVFREVSRVLRPGGAFCFVTPNVRHPVIAIASVALSASQRSRAAVQVEGREAAHVFPTFYRANSAARLRALAAVADLQVADIRVVRNIPFVRRPIPLTVAECLFIRATAHPALAWMGADIVGRLTKPALARAATRAAVPVSREARRADAPVRSASHSPDARSADSRA